MSTITAINLGTAPNDYTGDPLRTAGGKINTNFTNLNTDKLEGAVNGAAGLPNILISGTQYTGGSSTDTLPVVLLQPTGTTPVTNYSVNGTWYGVNAQSGFTGNFLACSINGASAVITVNYQGNIGTGGTITTGGNITAGGNFITTGSSTIGTAASVLWTGRGRITSPADGRFRLTNGGQTTFDRLTFGLETSAFPALKVNGAGLDVRLGDDSAYAGLTTGYLNFDRTITAGGTTGDRTINKPAGTVNFAAAASTITVTNSLVTTSSLIIAFLRKTDATATMVTATPGSGSFTLTLDSVAAAELSVGFIVLN